MPEQRNGLMVIRGSLPQATSRNGLDLAGTPYRYRGHPGWYPEGGVHRDPLEVAPQQEDGTGMTREQAAAMNAERRRRRLAEFEELWQGEGLGIGEAARRMGVSRKTGESYARELREAGGGSCSRG